MIPVIAARGASFAGAFAYYFHDKQARTSERVAWTQCLNLMTDCVEKGWKRMAYTAMHQKHLKRASGQRMTGAKMQKPVFCYSLSWHPEQTPSQQSIMEAVMKTLDILGLTEHQAIVAAHQDEPHSHVHVIVNAVHPLTGLVAKLKNTKRKLSKFALNHERKEGKVYCPQREENHAKREAGKKSRYCDPVISKAWENSLSGTEFIAALAVSGYQLAIGRRIVVVDPHGNVISPTRALGIKSKEFLSRLKYLDTQSLPSLDECISRLNGRNSFEQEIGPPKPLPPELKELQTQITVMKNKLRKSGILAKYFGLSAYRKRKIARMRRQFKETSVSGGFHLYQTNEGRSLKIDET